MPTVPDVPSIASGSEIYMDDGISEPIAFVLLGEVTKFGDLVYDAPLVDATRLNALKKEYVAGLPDTPAADLEFRLLMDDANQDELTGVHHVFNTGATRTYKIKFKNQTKGISFQAVPTGHGWTGLTPGELLKRVFKLKISGDVTVAVAT